jgi:hypothetical protein
MQGKEGGSKRSARGRITDIFTRQGAEKGRSMGHPAGKEYGTEALAIGRPRTPPAGGQGGCESFERITAATWGHGGLQLSSSRD